MRAEERAEALIELLTKYPYDAPDLRGRTPGGTIVGRGYRYRYGGNKLKQEQILRNLHSSYLQYALQASGRFEGEIISVRRYPGLSQSR